MYRYRLTKDDVLALDATLDPSLLEEAIGTFTWTLRDGTISLQQTDCQCSLGRVSGRYTATPSQLTVHWPAKAENGDEFCSGDCVETVDWRSTARRSTSRRRAPNGSSSSSGAVAGPGSRSAEPLRSVFACSGFSLN